jgi:hypothetical protein
MKWKEFKRLNIFSIPLFLILLVVGLFPTTQFGCFNYCPPQPPGQACILICTSMPIFYLPVALFFGAKFAAQFSSILLIFLLIFWYLVSYLIVVIYNKIKKKK